MESYNDNSGTIRIESNSNDANGKGAERIVNHSRHNIDVPSFGEASQTGYLEAASFKRPESNEQISSKIRIEEADARLKRIKDLLTFLIGTVMIVALFGICSYLLLQPGTTQDIRAWSMSVLMSIVSSIISYTMGKNTVSKN